MNDEIKREELSPAGSKDMNMLPDASVEEIQSFLKNQFDTSIKSLKRITNRVCLVFLLETDSKQLFILKHEKKNHNIVFRELLGFNEFHNLIPVSEVVYSSDLFLIKEFNKGIALNKIDEKLKPEIYVQYGKTIRKYHSKPTHFECCGKIIKSNIGNRLSFKEWYNSKVPKMLNTIKENGLIPDFQFVQLQRYLDNHVHFLNDTELYLINFDLIEDNIFWENNSVLMIDLDDLAIFPKEMDLAKIYLEHKNDGLFQYFLKGYGDVDIEKVKFCAVLDILGMIAANYKKNRRLIAMRENRKKVFTEIIRPNIKISIIITAYNIEEYVKQAIESAIEQTVKAYEIIVIDDGSSDNTVYVAREALKNIDNSKVVVQENSGPGGARNTGIRTATGEYIVFLDGDDWLLDDALETFNKYLTNNPDAVFSNRKLYREKSKEFKEDNTFTKTTQGIVKTKRELLRRFAIHSKIFKRKFLIENDIFFPLNMVWEDYPFAYKVLANASKINVTKDITYVFRKRSSENTSMTQKRRLDAFFLESRFKQIDLDLEIIFNSDLPKIFNRFNFYKMEFEKRLMWDIKYLAIEKDASIVNNAFKKFADYLEKNRELVFNNVSQPVQNIYAAMLDNYLEKTKKLINEYRR